MPHNNIGLQYLCNVLHLNHNNLNKLGHGCAIKTINQDKLKTFKIPVPSVEVQEELNKRVEELNKRVEELNKSVDERIAHVEWLKGVARKMFCEPGELP